MNENIKKFLEKLSLDQEAQAKFLATKDPDEAYRLASAIQDGFTKEEFIAAMEEMAKEAKLDEINDNDLNTLAGGGVNLEASIGIGASAVSSCIISYCAIGAAAI